MMMMMMMIFISPRAGTPEGKSPSKLATILRATKENKNKKNRKEKLRYSHLDKPVSTLSSSL